MASARFRFYEELNDFLPRLRRKTEFTHEFNDEFNARTSIKDMIEALGVPHPEVDLILVNGESVDFTYIVLDGDHISVYPMFEALDITPLLRLRPEPLRVSRFVLDTHLAKLARYLRLFGFDTLYRNDYDDIELARLSSSERRILLTRDQGLLKRRCISHGYYVRAIHPQDQIREILVRFDLYRQARPFSRCMRCNSALTEVAKAAIADRLEPNTRRYFERFWQCDGCKKLYWKGSHYQGLLRLVAQLQQSGAAASP